jgi:hypothetical protein
LSLSWEVDFDSKTIRGSAKHAVEVLQQTSQFVLDSKQLTITRATVQGQAAGALETACGCWVSGEWIVVWLVFVWRVCGCRLWLWICCCALVFC